MRLNNNAILITGGTSGIGLEIVKRFYNAGNRLIVASSNMANLNGLKMNYPDIHTVQCDLGSPSSVKSLIDTCLERHSDINIIINNAAIQYNYDWTAETDGYRKNAHETQVNFISPLHIIYGLLPLLIAKENGAIVNVSSGLALAPKKMAPVYCATKAAIHNMTKSLRYQLENTPVKVFEIMPPLVDTPMTKEAKGDKLSPKDLVDEFMDNFKNDILDSFIGDIKMLREMQRTSPERVDAILKKG